MRWKVLAAAVLLLVVEGLLGLVCCSTKSLRGAWKRCRWNELCAEGTQVLGIGVVIVMLLFVPPCTRGSPYGTLVRVYSELYCATWCRCSAMPLLLWTAVVMS